MRPCDPHEKKVITFTVLKWFLKLMKVWLFSRGSWYPRLPHVFKLMAFSLCITRWKKKKAKILSFMHKIMNQFFRDHLKDDLFFHFSMMWWCLSPQIKLFYSTEKPVSLSQFSLCKMYMEKTHHHAMCLKNQRTKPKFWFTHNRWKMLNCE